MDEYKKKVMEPTCCVQTYTIFAAGDVQFSLAKWLTSWPESCLGATVRVCGRARLAGAEITSDLPGRWLAGFRGASSSVPTQLTSWVAAALQSQRPSPSGPPLGCCYEFTTAGQVK